MANRRFPERGGRENPRCSSSRDARPELSRLLLKASHGSVGSMDPSLTISSAGRVRCPAMTSQQPRVISRVQRQALLKLDGDDAGTEHDELAEPGSLELGACLVFPRRDRGVTSDWACRVWG